MTDIPPEVPEGALYEPESVQLIDGELFVFDMVEFSEALNALAMQWVKGELFVLDRETRKWVNVECAKRPMKSVQ